MGKIMGQEGEGGKGSRRNANGGRGEKGAGNGSGKGSKGGDNVEEGEYRRGVVEDRGVYMNVDLQRKLEDKGEVDGREGVKSYGDKRRRF